jgi:hypothetical protein
VDQYNPLDKRNLGKSVAEALLDRALVPLPTLGRGKGFPGAGVYAIYYFGLSLPYPPYQPLADHNNRSEDLTPIYVGKAIPRGARTAGVGVDTPTGTALFSRLQKHAESITNANNLALNDFKCRFLLVDDIWIPLGESLLIQRYRPLWNVLIDGFGNHNPGAGRRNSRRPAWDTLHPGRPWANLLTRSNSLTEGELIQSIEDFFAGKVVPTKSVTEAMEDEES